MCLYIMSCIKKYDLDHLLEKEAHLLKVVKERLEERRPIAE